MFLFGKKAQFSRLCKDVISHLEDAVIILDAQHRIRFTNVSVEKIFGYRADELLGQPFDLLLPEQITVTDDPVLRSMATESLDDTPVRTRIEHRAQGVRKNGEECMLRLNIMSLNTGAESFIAAVVRDISKDYQSEAELLRLASTDPLTGAYNRREFTAIAEREAQRANRYGRPLSLLMLDIDHFKKLNDSYGHIAGDKALQRFVTLCSNTLRNVDIFARWGGEEFVALLPETGIEGASVISERLRRLIDENVLVLNNEKIKYTVSIGISTFQAGETSIDKPLARADDAVYEAKRAGRNQISVYREDS